MQLQLPIELKPSGRHHHCQLASAVRTDYGLRDYPISNSDNRS